MHTNEVAFTKYTHFVGTGIASGPSSFPPASVTGSGGGGSHVFHISPGKDPLMPFILGLLVIM